MIIYYSMQFEWQFTTVYSLYDSLLQYIFYMTGYYSMQFAWQFITVYVVYTVYDSLVQYTVYVTVFMVYDAVSQYHQRNRSYERWTICSKTVSC